MDASLREGIVGGSVSLGSFVASIPLRTVNDYLTSISLVIGIVVGVVTIYRWVRRKDSVELLDKVAQNERGLARVELQLIELIGSIQKLPCKITGCEEHHHKE